MLRSRITILAHVVSRCHGDHLPALPRSFPLQLLLMWQPLHDSALATQTGVAEPAPHHNPSPRGVQVSWRPPAYPDKEFLSAAVAHVAAAP
jgi:hypothetical protein